MKRRVTITLAGELLKAVDRAPGESRSEKIERLLKEALSGTTYRRWVQELKTFYGAGMHPEDRAEDLDWQALADRALTRDD
jgi:hypothetical protein